MIVLVNYSLLLLWCCYCCYFGRLILCHYHNHLFVTCFIIIPTIKRLTQFLNLMKTSINIITNQSSKPPTST